MKKIHQAFFGLLLLLLPTQLGKHFWPNFAFISGLRLDYYSPAFYFTDLLILLILIFFISEKVKKFKQKIKKLPGLAKKNILIISFLTYLFINAFLSPSPGPAIFKFLKIIEFFFLGIYLTQIKFKPAHHLCFSISLFYTFLIALFQFIKKASLGGIFYWLGERTFNLSTPGIAKIVIGGQEILRPYATLPHPNVLGGFTLVSLIFLLTLNLPKIIEKPLLISCLITIFLSFSRTAWVATAIFLPPTLFATLSKKKSKKITFWKPIFVGLGLIILTVSLLKASTSNSRLQDFAFSSSSISLRIKLNQAAVEMIKTHPLTGVGLNNFIFSLPHYSPQIFQTLWLQPAHNLYLLIASETGLLGFFLFSSLLFFSFKKALSLKKFSLIPLLCILFLGFFDHYFFTLQQAMLLFTFILSLPWAQKT